MNAKIRITLINGNGWGEVEMNGIGLKRGDGVYIASMHLQKCRELSGGRNVIEELFEVVLEGNEGHEDSAKFRVAEVLRWLGDTGDAGIKTEGSVQRLAVPESAKAESDETREASPWRGDPELVALADIIGDVMALVESAPAPADVKSEATASAAEAAQGSDDPKMIFVTEYDRLIAEACRAQAVERARKLAGMFVLTASNLGLPTWDIEGAEDLAVEALDLMDEFAGNALKGEICEAVKAELRPVIKGLSANIKFR